MFIGWRYIFNYVGNKFIDRICGESRKVLRRLVDKCVNVYFSIINTNYKK